MRVDRSPRVFLSYAREDREHMAALVRSLRHEGIEVWTDADVAAGADIRVAIKDALLSSDVVLALVTRPYLASAWSGAEMGAAWMLGKRVVTLVEDERLLERLPEGLDVAQVVRFGPGAEGQVADALRAA